MIQFTLSATTDPDVFELRSSAVGSNTASKSPHIVSTELLTPTILILLRAALMEVGNV